MSLYRMLCILIIPAASKTPPPPQFQFSSLFNELEAFNKVSNYYSLIGVSGLICKEIKTNLNCHGNDIFSYCT